MDGETIEEAVSRWIVDLATVVAKSDTMPSNGASSNSNQPFPAIHTEAYVRDWAISRIIRDVSRDVSSEKSHIFHDCDRPSERTIKLTGETDRTVRSETTQNYRIGDWTH